MERNIFYRKVLEISMKIVRCNCFTAVMRRINMQSEWKWNVSIVIKWKDMIKYDNGEYDNGD